MMACLDVGYRDDKTIAACLVFAGWGSDRAEYVIVKELPPAPPYEPGMFYRRELHCLLQVMPSDPLDGIIVDGFVWTSEDLRPGLGAHLFEAIGRRSPVVGVAKTRLRGAPAELVVRGESTSPLFVSAVGLEVREAAEHVRRMHGTYRVPTLLKEVDRLSRGVDPRAPGLGGPPPARARRA